MNQDPVSDLIGKIYTAALDPRHWTGVADSISDHLGATITNISRTDGVTYESSNIAPRVAPEYLTSYADYWVKHNPLLEPAARKPMGSVFSLEECLPIKDLRRTEMYAEWLAPQGMNEGLASFLGIEGTVGTSIAVWRPSRLGSFGAKERALMATLAPHLLRAVKISQRIAAVDSLGVSAVAALDQLRHGIALVDGAGRLRFLNPSAEAIIAPKDALRVFEGRLAAVVNRHTATLQGAINRAVTAHCGSALQIPRNGRKRALTLLISPLQRDAMSLGLRPPGALLIITDPERGDVPPTQRLAQAYALTPAEAAIAVELLEGKKMTAIADISGITYETARTHLRRIFIKTGVHRQSELIRLLMRELSALN